MQKIYNKNLSIVIIGFGSIGKRHYKNLKQLGYNNLSVFDPDHKAYFDFKDARKLMEFKVELLKNFKVAFICSPNNLHIKQALNCARAGLHLFIEKPLSHNLSGVNELIALCEKKKLIAMVGCNMRFHPCLNFIKKNRTRLGKIYNIFHECGYYLPYWRPNQDYRKNYAAKRSTGGGIILDDIHEFDLLFWLNDFNQVIESSFIYNNTSALEIDTEDNALASFKFKNKVLGLVKCDYLQQAYSRKCKIVGAKGNLEWDFKENIVWLKTKEKSKKIFEIKNFDFNQTYLSEIKYFFECLFGHKKTFNDINIAAQVLKYCVNK